MNVQHACEYLNCTEDDLEDAFELALFDWKNSVLQKPLLVATLKSKWVIWQKLLEIQQFLRLDLGAVNAEQTEVSQVYGATVLEQFHRYAAANAQFRLAFNRTTHLIELKSLVLNALKLEIWNASYYSEYIDWCDETPVFGKFIDEMRFLKELQQQEKEGKKQLIDLWKDKSELPLQLRLDLKRLSLLSKYLKDE